MEDRVQGNQRAGNTFDTNAEAHAKGQDIARDRGTEHVVKKMDGTVGEAKRCGADPADRVVAPPQAEGWPA